MKSLVTLLFVVISLTTLSAQFSVIDGTGGIIDQNTTTNFYPLTATGLTNSFVVDGLCMDISHTELSALSISLIAPDGTTVLLTENQTTGSLLDNTCFSVNANNSISTQSSPYSGFHMPLESVSLVNNGQSLNGLWQLAISSITPTTVNGTVDHWEIGFFNTNDSTINCPDNLNILMLTGSNTYTANQTITSTATISNNDSITYRAGVHIDLNGDFDVSLGGDFLGQIQSCNGGGDTTTMPPVDTTNTLFNLSGISTFMITQEIDGVMEERPITVRAPNVIDPTINYPLLFAFHGNGGVGASFANNGELNTIINNENVIGIYPQGFNNAWNLGPENTNADDIAFVDSIMQYLSTYNNLDLTSVYAIGNSNGAAMINELARQRSHFNAIAPVVSQLNVNQALITPPQSISVYQVNGDMDGLIPINGGNSAVGQNFLSAQASAEDWAAEFNCDASPTTSTTSTWGNFTVNSFYYENCNDGNIISYHIIVNGGHGAVQGTDPTFYQKMWDFLKVH